MEDRRRTFRSKNEHDQDTAYGSYFQREKIRRKVVDRRKRRGHAPFTNPWRKYKLTESLKAR